MERQLSLGHSCWVAMTPGLQARLFVGLQNVAEDGKSGDYYWFHMEDDENAGRPDHWLHMASQEEKLAHVKKSMSTLEPRLREIIDLTSAANIKDVQFIYRDAELSGLPGGRVALLGDAAHPMTPCRTFFPQPS
jgi:hypothetical protein